MTSLTFMSLMYVFWYSAMRLSSGFENMNPVLPSTMTFSPDFKQAAYVVYAHHGGYAEGLRYDDRVGGLSPPLYHDRGYLVLKEHRYEGRPYVVCDEDRALAGLCRDAPPFLELDEVLQDPLAYVAEVLRLLPQIFIAQLFELLRYGFDALYDRELGGDLLFLDLLRYGVPEGGALEYHQVRPEYVDFGLG